MRALLTKKNSVSVLTVLLCFMGLALYQSTIPGCFITYGGPDNWPTFYNDYALFNLTTDCVNDAMSIRDVVVNNVITALVLLVPALLVRFLAFRKS